MTAKNYMLQIKSLEIQIGYKKDQIEQLEELLEAPKTVGFGDEVVSGGRVPDRLAGLVCKLADLKDEYSRDVERLVALKDEIIKKMDKVTSEYPDGAEVLYKRYFQRKNWATIAEEMSYSAAQIYRIHGRALLYIDEQIRR